MPDVQLRVNGLAYAGWKTVRITRGVEAVAGGFALGFSDRWGNIARPWPIQEEDECSVALEGEVVLTGYVDRRRLSYSASEHSLSVEGRDRTGAMVDCSAVLKSWEFHNIELLNLATKLCEPFGISVRLDATVGKISIATGKGGGHVTAGGTGKTALGVPKAPRKFCIDPGESAFEVLDRACRMAGVLPVSDGQGGLVLTRAGSDRVGTPLIEGENILSGSVEYDATARYRKYIVGAQHPATADWLDGSVTNAVSGSATDENVRRAERVLMIRPEASCTPAMAKVRAAWEAKVRAARGDTVTITVQGWTTRGALWPVNALVPLRSPRLEIDGEMLITQAVFSLDPSGGSTTELTLRRPDAFIPEPTVTKASTGLWKEIENGA
jgi:prophage tail gpP-like protein